ncbi:MAG: heavy-metal-associated domain-containing protein [Aestuariibaculum sp.]
MKQVFLSLAVVMALVFTGCKDETKKTAETANLATASFGVRGNCGMCKKTIEKAANGVEGVASADWDKAKKKIDVSFNGDKTNTDAIEKAIAASGYDTEHVAGSEEAYKNLPGCCQYDHNMAMNQTGEAANHD